MFCLFYIWHYTLQTVIIHHFKQNNHKEISKENEFKRWNGLTVSCYANFDDDNGEIIMMWLLILLWGEPFYINVSFSLFNMFNAHNISFRMFTDLFYIWCWIVKYFYSKNGKDSSQCKCNWEKSFLFVEFYFTCFRELLTEILPFVGYNCRVSLRKVGIIIKMCMG